MVRQPGMRVRRVASTVRSPCPRQDLLDVIAGGRGGEQQRSKTLLGEDDPELAVLDGALANTRSI
jgi:hypothetical protein